jgi:hypothetical protein
MVLEVYRWTIVYFSSSALDKWSYFGVGVSNSCSLCPEQTVFAVLYAVTIFIKTRSVKLKELQKQSWSNTVEGQIINRLDAWRDDMSGLYFGDTRFESRLGHGLPWWKSTVFIGYLETTTQVVRSSKTTTKRLYAAEFLTRWESLNWSVRFLRDGVPEILFQDSL